MKSNFERAKEDLAQKVQELVTNNETKSDSIDSKDTNESKEVKTEVLSSEQGSQEPELSEVEKQAYALGWRPQGEYSGANFVPADEYVRRQPLFERIDRQSKELKDLKNLVQMSASHMAALRKEAYEQALRDLEQKKLQAVDSGDRTEFSSREQDIRNVQAKMASDPLINDAIQHTQQQPAKQELHPEAMSFEQRNASWYNTNNSENRRMMEAANLIDRQLAEEASEKGIVIDPKVHLKTVEDRIRTNFPHRFENPKKDQPSMVGRSTSSKDRANTSTLVAKLTPEQRRLGEYFQRSNKDYTLEKYAADLDRLGNLK